MSFKDDVKKYVDKGLSVSKEALTKAGSAVSKFGDDSVVRLEKHKKENLLKQEVLEIGYEVIKIFVDEQKDSISASDEVISSKLMKIKDLKVEILHCEELLSKG